VDWITDKLASWASILEDATRRQAVQTAERPFVRPHMALMPDAHLGKGATVGSVIPTDAAVMPAAVGVDIGCGMIALRTQFTADEVRAARRDLTGLHAAIAQRVPLSAGKYNRKLTATAVPRVTALRELADAASFDPARYAGNWELQLGSLGSGNHFVEVTVDERGRVWLFLHTGSRGVGNRIAQRHIGIARDECAALDLPDRDLAHLTEGTASFAAYIREMQWAQEFARLNREEIMDRCIAALAEWVRSDVQRVEEINCHHNYTTRETHLGHDVWLSRKGAIDASRGARGLIPGSMGSASYVVTGKGEPLSLHSSPHGAGRNYSRTAARKRFTRESLDAAMRGVAWGRSDAFLDEHPEAYKSIDVVMRDAADLVAVDHTLRQIVNVKGN